MKMEQAWMLMNDKVGVIFESARIAAIATVTHVKLSESNGSSQFCVVRTWIVRAKHLVGEDFVFHNGKFYPLDYDLELGLGFVDFSQPRNDIAIPPFACEHEFVEPVRKVEVTVR